VRERESARERGRERAREKEEERERKRGRESERKKWGGGERDCLICAITLNHQPSKVECDTGFMAPASSAALGEIVTGFEVVCDELGFTAG
jgi:hypothetical protein